MVVIECPHCSEDIEMEDDAYGLFDCPYCDNEYEWGEAPKKRLRKKKNTKTPERKTKTLEKKKKSKPVERKKRFNHREEKNILEYGGIQVSALFATFGMLMLIFTGLNSDEWYTADWWEEYDNETRVSLCDLSEGTGSGGTWTIGTSEIIREDVRDTRTGNCWNGNADGEEYESTSIRGEDFSTTLFEIDGRVEVKEEYCEDVPEYLDSDEEKEFEAKCKDDLEELGEQYDWYNSWDNAGTLIKIFMIFSFIFCLFILSVKTYLLLQQIGIINSSPDLTRKISTFDNLLSSIMAGIVVFGLILYWLLIPDFNHLFRLNDNWEEPDDYSYGLGMIWWSLMIYSFIYIAISVLGMGKRASSN